jgi:hypothetical protein
LKGLITKKTDEFSFEIRVAFWPAIGELEKECANSHPNK